MCQNHQDVNAINQCVQNNIVIVLPMEICALINVNVKVVTIVKNILKKEKKQLISQKFKIHPLKKKLQLVQVVNVKSQNAQRNIVIVIKINKNAMIIVNAIIVRTNQKRLNTPTLNCILNFYFLILNIKYKNNNLYQKSETIILQLYIEQRLNQHSLSQFDENSRQPKSPIICRGQYLFRRNDSMNYSNSFGYSRKILIQQEGPYYLKQDSQGFN